MRDTIQEGLVNDAFSRQSPIFDQVDEENKLILWVRKRVRDEVMHYIKKEDKMLELNAGTGIDSCFFSSKGINVLATDNAEGMLQKLSQKIERNKIDNLKVKKCSFNNLEQLKGSKFNYIFSNFAGLNCTNNLGKVLDDINDLLEPGGYFSLVILPKFCPWEVAMLLKGDFKLAFRRFKKNGAPAHLESVHFKCYYYNPGFILNRMKKYKFKLKTLKGLSILVPPPAIENFIEDHPKAFRLLENIENKICDKWPFNRWGDHYIITMQKR
jgi:ubiquinone/menaquinone biosynthesis C-methylase UbiE